MGHIFDRHILHISIGPHPRIVRMFACEKGLTLEERTIDILQGENLSSEFRAINPLKQLPVLILPDGTAVAEASVICEYVEDLAPDVSRIGACPKMRAETRMWSRRVDLHYAQPLIAAFRFGPALPFFKSRVHCIPQAADDFRTIMNASLIMFDQRLVGSEFLNGSFFSLADIWLYCFIDFARHRAGFPVDEQLFGIHRWLGAIDARPSAAMTRADADATDKSE